jgi:SAM-dependent methyltransferase
VEYLPIIKGLLTQVPCLYRPGAGAQGGSVEAQYCYCVWLRHLRVLAESGMVVPPRSVAELGPGLSLGVGLAAILSGASQYVALDVSQDASVPLNQRLLRELASFFKNRAPIAQYPEVLPKDTRTEFPDDYLSESLLEQSLSPARVTRIESLIDGLKVGSRADGDLAIKYVVPWASSGKSAKAAFDLVIAQAVMEHVVDLDATYREIARIVRPGGWFSAAIDFRSHGLTQAWNGHWTYSQFFWRRVLGSRRWSINRAPYSTHLALLRQHGFDVILSQPVQQPSAIRRCDLASSFRSLGDADLTTPCAYVAARRQHA